MLNHTARFLSLLSLSLSLFLPLHSRTRYFSYRVSLFTSAPAQITKYAAYREKEKEREREKKREKERGILNSQNARFEMSEIIRIIRRRSAGEVNPRVPGRELLSTRGGIVLRNRTRDIAARSRLPWALLATTSSTRPRAF